MKKESISYWRVEIARLQLAWQEKILDRELEKFQTGEMPLSTSTEGVVMKLSESLQGIRAAQREIERTMAPRPAKWWDTIIIWLWKWAVRDRLR